MKHINYCWFYHHHH